MYDYYSPNPNDPSASAPFDPVAGAPVGGGGDWFDENAGDWATAAPAFETPRDYGMSRLADFGGGASYAGSSFAAPGGRPDDLMDKWGQTFEFDPSKLDQDKGYQFALGQGIKARERAAAARGTLMTPGLLQELEEFGSGLANTYLGDAYGRALNTYNTNYGTFAGDRTRRSNEYNAQFGQALAGTQANNANAMNAFNAERSNRMDNHAIAYGAERDRTNDIFRLADYGNAAAGNQAAAAQRFGESGSNIMQSQGNARAAGQVGAANALVGGANSIADYGLSAAYLRRGPQ